MAKFDLKEMLSERSSQELTPQPKGTVYRDVFELIPSKNNFYNTDPESLEDLKSSIQLFGVMQNVIIQNVDGKDHIISGHRRTLCCRMLVEEGHEEFRKIECKYSDFAEHAMDALKIEEQSLLEENQRYVSDEEKKRMAQEILEHMAIVQANRFRKMSDWEKMREVILTEQDIKELRKLADLEGTTRDMIKKTLGVSGTQIARYQSINNNLSEELMKAFEKNKINVSVAAELAGLDEKYQAKAHEILEENDQLTLNEAKFLKSQQEQEKDIPGQLTIDQALHPHHPAEINTPIPVDIQIDQFYEALKRNIKDYVKKSDLNMTIYMLSSLYGAMRVRNGQLNYQGTKGGILFNIGSDREELMGWTEFSKKLIEKYGKKQKIKMAAVDEPKKLTIQEVIARFHNEYSEPFTKMMRAIRPAKNDHESAIMAQKALAPCNFSGFSGPEMMNCEFRSLSAGAKFEYKGRTLKASYRYLVKQARFMYDPFLSEFDKPEKEARTGFAEKKDNLPVQPKCITGQSRSGFCGTAAYCEETYDCCAQCPDDCNIRCGWLKERCQPAAESQDEKQQNDFAEPTKAEEYSAETSKTPDHAGDATAMLPEAWPEFLKDIPVPAETALNDYLDDQEKDLKQLLEIEKESSGLPHTTVLRQQMVVAGLRLLGKLIKNMEVQDE